MTEQIDSIPGEAPSAKRTLTETLREAFRFKSTLLVLLLLAATCFLAYSNSLHNEFMLDDFFVLFSETGMSRLDSLSELFTGRQDWFYRPVGFMLLAVSQKVFGSNEFGYHATNLVLFFLICAMFFFITEELFGRRQLSVLVAFLYAVHPINGGVVNYATMNVAGTFVLCLQLSFFLFLLFLRHEKNSFHWFALIAFTWGLLSHPVGVIFPFYLFCLLYFLKQVPLTRCIWLCLPSAAISAGYLLFRLFFFAIQGVYEHTAFAVNSSVFSYLATIIDLDLWYFSKLFFMKDIVFLWTGVFVTEGVAVRVVLGVAVAAALGYLLLGVWKRGLNAFALAVLAGGFLPAAIASFVHYPMADPMIEPHWFYFSSFGFFLLLANGILYLKKWVRGETLAVVVCALLVAGVLVVRSANTNWKDEATYSYFWLSVSPRNLTPYLGYGNSLLDQGKCEDAISYFTQGTELVKSTAVKNYLQRYPDLSSEVIDQFTTQPLVYNAMLSAHLGVAYVCVGNYGAAVQSFQTAIQANPRLAIPYHYFGQFLLKSQAYEDATVMFSNAVRVNPESLSSYQYLLAARAASRNQIEEARSLMNQAKALEAEIPWYTWNLDRFAPTPLILPSP